jgi:nicotinate phosphoribosyltransferase
MSLLASSLSPLAPVCHDRPAVPGTSHWVGSANAALLTDLYQLTMLQAYWSEGMDREAVFSLFVRRLPRRRNYLLACGLGEALAVLEELAFDTAALDYLAGLGLFRREFLDWLAGWRFHGDVYAVPEGTPVFAEEPLLEVVAPLPQAQLLETVLMNQIHHATLLASKAIRVRTAARDRKVVDFGLRRMHGADSGIKAARACHVAGFDATSNVLAGRLWGLPVAGTMAHSYIQAHDDEGTAFAAFARLYPGTTLLVDTYDTLDGVRQVVELARRGAAVGAVRLDSGDLLELARESRRILDDAGFPGIEIFASGGLDEEQIDRLLAAGAPIDGFGVGTALGVSADAPSLDFVYKLTAYAGCGRTKLSPGKRILPGRKQVFRLEQDGVAVRDVLGAWGEEHPGRPLLTQVMARGRRVGPGTEPLDEARTRARREVGRLPERLRALPTADPPYEVGLSPELARRAEEVEERARG